VPVCMSALNNPIEILKEKANLNFFPSLRILSACFPAVDIFHFWSLTLIPFVRLYIVAVTFIRFHSSAYRKSENPTSLVSLVGKLLAMSDAP